jgi:hypothetical protein
MEKFLPSGALLEGAPLSYQESWHVSQALVKEIERLKIDLDKIDLSQLTEANPNDIKIDFILQLKDPLCSILGSQKIVEAVDKCFAKFTYDKMRITSQTFEKREARQDYLFAAFYVLWENVSPFFAGLSSFSKTS